MKESTKWVDFDDLIYLRMDHSPGYRQWQVMLNLGQAKIGDETPESSVILRRFFHRWDAERFKENVYLDCTKRQQPVEKG